MGKLTEQIREAILASGTTRYVLAKQVGIAESALSRFMAGKQGLTLATLDKLADILGLELITTVQRAQRRSPTGRKRKEKPPNPKLTKADWQRMAASYAKDAYENHFSARRGVWHLQNAGALCFYNNNPYARFPDLRDAELASFRSRLKAARFKELAFATYPPPSEEDAGYTFALLVDADESRIPELCGWWNEIVAEFFRRMQAAPMHPNDAS